MMCMNDNELSQIWGITVTSMIFLIWVHDSKDLLLEPLKVMVVQYRPSGRISFLVGTRISLRRDSLGGIIGLQLFATLIVFSRQIHDSENLLSKPQIKILVRTFSCNRAIKFICYLVSNLRTYHYYVYALHAYIFIHHYSSMNMPIHYLLFYPQ